MPKHGRDDLLDDLERACSEAGHAVTMAEYRRHDGIATPETFINRFGSWAEAHELVGNDISSRGGVKR